jgi:hypothetical protein
MSLTIEKSITHNYTRTSIRFSKDLLFQVVKKM